MGEFIGKLLLGLLMWIVLLPIVLLLATPIILVACCFGSKPYGQKVKSTYGRIFDAWGRVSIDPS